MSIGRRDLFNRTQLETVALALYEKMLLVGTVDATRFLQTNSEQEQLPIRCMETPRTTFQTTPLILCDLTYVV
eukprot:4131417-Amphidinium_carterae.1